MRILCNGCGKSASTEIPEGTIIRAWVECPECIEKDMSDEKLTIAIKALEYAATYSGYSGGGNGPGWRTTIKKALKEITELG